MDESREAGEGDETVEMTVEIANGRTVITVSGERDAAIVVRSRSGERIYLPPEDFDRPVQAVRQSPYDGAGQSVGPVGDGDAPTPEATPYTPTQTPESPGKESTPDGFQIVHPEPVTDLRLLR